MQLQTVLKRASIGLLAGMAMMSQAQAVSSSKDDNLMCAAYMDIAVADLYPLKLIPYAKAKQMLSSRFLRLATTSISTDESISTVVDSFINSRNQAREALLKNNQFNDLRLNPERDLLTYAQAIDKQMNQYCPKGNASYEAMANNYDREDILAMVVEISKEFKKHGEK
ncbi:hypothetical protein ACTXJO_04535 [Psychrobacter celer]|uniref:hypothetical protein n=1 Tax=Psychrobacter celer TaxID=306572 RepID=UPI003FD2F2DE